MARVKARGVANLVDQIAWKHRGAKLRRILSLLVEDQSECGLSDFDCTIRLKLLNQLQGSE
jgi:hypothetical protein